MSILHQQLGGILASACISPVEQSSLPVCRLIRGQQLHVPEQNSLSTPAGPQGSSKLGGGLLCASSWESSSKCLLVWAQDPDSLGLNPSPAPFHQLSDLCNFEQVTEPLHILPVREEEEGDLTHRVVQMRFNSHSAPALIPINCHHLTGVYALLSLALSFFLVPGSGLGGRGFDSPAPGRRTVLGQASSLPCSVCQPSEVCKPNPIRNSLSLMDKEHSRPE